VVHATKEEEEEGVKTVSK